MSKILTGQVPNLPWWKVLTMTDEEIANYNAGFLVEREMSAVRNFCRNCNSFHDQRIDCMYVGTEAKIAQDKMNRSVYYREIWNEAIEACLNELNLIGHTTYSDEERIKGLKK